MEPVIRNVRDLDQTDRSALERVVGQELSDSHQVIVQVVENPEHCPATGLEVPDWWKVYEGLSDDEVDRLDAAIRVRADLSREFEESDVRAP